MAHTAEALQSAANGERNVLVEQYFWLVRQIAAKLIKNLRGADFDDLVGDGVFGLMKAVESFDPARGVKFETYATPVIRGAILNGLRALDWVPERKRTRTRELQKVMDEFQLVHGREGTEEELARELEVSAQEVYDLIADLGTQYLLSLDQPVSSNAEDERSVMDTLEDKSIREPAKEFQFEEERSLLVKAISELPEREGTVVNRHYIEHRCFEEIAAELRISKQRVSQLHSKAIKKLRVALTAREDGALNTLLEGAFLF